ncbi:Hsp20/alpha crystallin family protein [Methanocalculus sp.]|uniref:Hsp20/alpha crystallin family protein n=1 Tax=Methanocalculus sp. TaxID=2004547 RepID=UPI0026179955|nr:Hsp20/alpha crystallin family protein [Methanocalculus sp.]MDG6250136.1 Hsp20/alpha crystallin family protein [Methanocalculus sp.]
MNEPPSDAYRELIDAVRKIMAESMDVDLTSPRVMGFRVVINGSPVNISQTPFDEEEHAVEVYEINDDLIIATDVSGYDPEEIRIFFEGGRLHIVSHERREPIAVVDLPQVDPDNIRMSCINGVLEIICRKDSDKGHQVIHLE